MSQTIRPDTVAFDSPLELLAKQVVEGFITGLHKSPFHGFSVEFAEHRLYNAGDSMKHVDWKLYAKTDKLFSKRYEEETNLRCQMMIDTSSSMYFPSPAYHKLSFSVQSVAALIFLLKKQRDAFGLTLFSDHVDLLTPARSTGAHQKHLFHHLEQLLAVPKEPKKTNLAGALHQVAEQIHQRSLVIIFSDFLQTTTDERAMNELFSALQHLKFNKHEVIVFNVMDRQKELNFDFENRPYQFIDLETGDSLKVHPRQVKEAYLQEMEVYRKQLKLTCARYQIDFVDADMNQGFSQILEAYLLKRQRMA